MKKSLLALAVLGAFAGVASAQSSVTLYGTLDVNGTYLKNSGQSRRYSLGTDGINSSQLGFRGVEDLGGGLKAGFTIISGINPDTGTANGKFWNRRSTVSLFSNAGELRLGRDYTPIFWNQTIFDAFGANGIGEGNGIRQLASGVRSDNSIGYFLPSNLGGFYGQAMVAAAEGGTTNAGGSSSDKVGTRLYSGRFGFAAGPFDVAAAYGTQRFGNPLNTIAGTITPFGAPAYIVNGGQSLKTFNIGGAYDFGFLKLLGYFEHEKVTATIGDVKENMFSISTVIPMGQGEVHLGYNRSKVKSAAVLQPTVDLLAATYQYNLSKRTAMYATVARLANKDATHLNLGAPTGNVPGFPTDGGNSKGFQLGVRHFF